MEQINSQIQNISNNGVEEEVIFKCIINYSNHHFRVFFMYMTLMSCIVVQP